MRNKCRNFLSLANWIKMWPQSHLKFTCANECDNQWGHGTTLNQWFDVFRLCLNTWTQYVAPLFSVIFIDQDSAPRCCKRTSWSFAFFSDIHSAFRFRVCANTHMQTVVHSKQRQTVCDFIVTTNSHTFNRSCFLQKKNTSPALEGLWNSFWV